MTTDITELAQSLKAAAEKATPGQWMRSSVKFNSITDIANPMEQGNKPHIANTSEKRDAEFIAMANPANILALVEALEKAQRAQPCEHSMFWDASGVKRCSRCELPEHANVHYADAAEMEIAAFRQRIAELESRLNSADKLQDSAFRSGLQHGFSLGQTDDQKGYEQSMAAYSLAAGIKVEAE